MRLPAFVILAVSSIGWSAAGAAPGNSGSVSAQASPDVACDAVKQGVTPGLYNLCVAYCAPRDQSNVDRNDLASVRAAAPNVRFLERYNELKSDDDPEMPCLEGGEPDPEPQLPSCTCWSPEELQQIDGIVSGSTMSVACPTYTDDLGVYRAEIYEGLNLGTATARVYASAFAYFDRDDPTVQGCMLQIPDTPTKNLTLTERSQAQACIEEIQAQCALVN